VSRTAFYKLYYFGILIGLPLVVFAATVGLHLPSYWAGLALLLLLIPGRILAYFWRDLLRGLKLLHEKRYEDSIRYNENFLAELQRRPWIRHMIWLGTSSYSRNPKSLAYNNLGAAEFALGRLDAARAHLHEAIREDNLNPLPFHNLALVANKEGNQLEAALMTSSALARGLSFGMTDKIVMGSQKRYAGRSGG
jgi:tetratricopeptide (TPR) repeat protein